MSAIIRASGPADIEPICELLHTKMNARIPLARWRQLMTYKWLKDKPDFGRIVVDQGQVLGFCGMVYADRVVGDPGKGFRKERIVSMSSWYLDKTLRGQGLGRDMLLSAIEDPTLTYATLTNSRKPLAIVEALGFKVLEDRRYLWNKAGAVDPKMRVIKERAIVAREVPEYQRQILHDMDNQPVVPMLLQSEGAQSLLYFSIKTKGEGVCWFDLQYSSDHSLFTACAQSLANLLLPDQSSVLAADGRFVEQEVADGVCEPLPVSRYYVSQRVAPHEIDHLYSELQLLDLKLD